MKFNMVLKTKEGAAMKIMILCSIFILIFFAPFVRHEHVYAGPIPVSLIQSDEEIAKTKTCKGLEEQRSKILKKISELKREEEKYLAELEGMEKNYCES
jgi:hypothetical protein